MIRRGLNPEVLSDRLGHTDHAFTLHGYTHLYNYQREEAAFDLSDFFPVAPGGAELSQLWHRCGNRAKRPRPQQTIETKKPRLGRGFLWCA